MDDAIAEERDGAVKDAKDLILTDIRDGVAIDLKRAWHKRGKFDMELIRAGTRFPLHFELVLDGSKDVELISCLVTCMDALEGESFRARNRKGFGSALLLKFYSNNCCWKVRTST